MATAFGVFFWRRSLPALLAVAMGSVACPAAAAEPLQGTPEGTIDGHPALAASPRHTTTRQGHSGDAINIAFIGSEADLHRTLAAAGWYASDPITLESSIRIGPDIDKERNKLVSDTIRAGVLDGYYWVDRFHQLPQGRNGGGDPYFTDRRLAVGVITSRR